MTNPADGLHYDVPFADYLHWPITSQSTLKEGLKSMAHYQAALAGERVKEPTDDMILGTALHTAFLEPEEVRDRVVVWNGGPRRGKEWNAFTAEWAGYIIITQNQHWKLEGMLKSLRAHPEVKRWLGRIESVETSVVGEVHGLKFKGRCDALTADPLIDLKKVADADPRKIMNAVMTYGYHIQAYVYTQLFQRNQFVMICIEEDPPFDVVHYEMSPAFMRIGLRKTRRLIEQVKKCNETGIWPGRSLEPVLLEPPEYALEEITFGD